MSSGLTCLHQHHRPIVFDNILVVIEIHLTTGRLVSRCCAPPGRSLFSRLSTSLRQSPEISSCPHVKDLTIDDEGDLALSIERTCNSSSRRRSGARSNCHSTCLRRCLLGLEQVHKIILPRSKASEDSTSEIYAQDIYLALLSPSSQLS